MFCVIVYMIMEGLVIRFLYYCGINLYKVCDIYFYDRIRIM